MEIILDNGEPVENVQETLIEEGYKILAVEKLGESSTKVLVGS